MPRLLSCTSANLNVICDFLCNNVYVGTTQDLKMLSACKQLQIIWAARRKPHYSSPETAGLLIRHNECDKIYCNRIIWDSHHENAVRPPVGAVRVSSPVHHLWSHVLHRAAERVGLVLVVYRLLAEAEVWAHKRTHMYKDECQLCMIKHRESSSKYLSTAAGVRVRKQKRCKVTHRSAWCVPPHRAGCWNNRRPFQMLHYSVWLCTYSLHVMTELSQARFWRPDLKICGADSSSP